MAAWNAVQLRVDNIFDSKPQVHDALGNVPLNFQPDLLDPLGRTIMISFRKLFLPDPELVPKAIPGYSTGPPFQLTLHRNS